MKAVGEKALRLWGLAVMSMGCCLVSCNNCEDTGPRIRVVNYDTLPVTLSVLTGTPDTAYFLNIAPLACTGWRTFNDFETQVVLFDSLMAAKDSAVIDLRNCHEYELRVDSAYQFTVEKRHRD